MLITNLSNYIQPFIRYELTDRIIVHNDKCPCGKSSRWLEIEGRTDDILAFEGGVLIAPMSFYKILEEIKEITRFQLVQRSYQKLELRLVAEDTAAAFEKAEKELQAFLNSKGITMHYKHTNRPGFLLGFIDFFTAGLFFLFYMPRGLQNELEEILGHKVRPYWQAYLLGIPTLFIYPLIWMGRIAEELKKKALELGIEGKHTSFRHMVGWNILGILLFGYAVATQRFFHTLNRVEKELNHREIQMKMEGKQMKKQLNVIQSRCPQNHPCPSVKVCPVGALSQKGFNAPTVDRDKCIACGKCSNFCPKKALVLEET